MFLDEHPVFEEVHNLVVARDHYARYYVRCKCPAHQEGRGCVKKRNAGSAQTAELGEMEPFAFLGAWLRLASGCSTRKAHKDKQPSQEEVRAYAVEMGWAPSEAAQLEVH